MAHKDGKTPRAVALNYDHDTMGAPVVLAKGKGTVAEKIIALAAEHGIPVKEDPVLVKALEQLELGDQIPPELYRVVAEILVFIMQTDAKYPSR
jgi:flagellar biosynthesis protein